MGHQGDCIQVLPYSSHCFLRQDTVVVAVCVGLNFNPNTRLAESSD